MTTQTEQDLRGQARTALSLPITLEGDEGVTLDLSAQGLLLEAHSRPAVGSHVSLALHYEAGDIPCRLRCDGEVVRVEPQGDAFNIAVRLREPLFR